jgi:ubiquinone/menaquinone biosynthesis C-methylase UbiE
MSGPVMLVHMLLERLSRRELPRIPEPDLVMDTPEQIEAFAACGREDGVLTPIYFFNALHAANTIRPGSTVLDLACGPCNQLAQIAHLHPECRFIGVDASANMLSLGEEHLDRQGVHNVILEEGDICVLDMLADASVDSVTCTLSLHHLPDTNALMQAMRAVRRVLKPGGGIYLSDFGRLKRAATQRYFAHDRQDCQPPQFTADFLNSMRAAFSVDELGRAISQLGALGLSAGQIHKHATVLAPFMVVFKRAVSAKPTAETQRLARSLFQNLSVSQQGDFKDLSMWFQAAGLRMPFALD